MAVIGAGPVGGALALTLASRGYKVDVFEKRENPAIGIVEEKGRSYNLAAFLRSQKTWRRIGVWEEMLKGSAPMPNKCLMGSDGTQYKSNWVSKPENLISTRRSHIYSVLNKKMKEVPSITAYYKT